MSFRFTTLLAAMLAVALTFKAPSAAASFETSGGPLEIARVAGGFVAPRSLAVLPEGGALVIERAGRILHVSDQGSTAVVANPPQVWAEGQGGLLDIVAARDFAESREVFISFTEARAGGGALALAAARFSADKERLEALRVIFRTAEAPNGVRRLGGRIAEAHDGPLFLTIGDREAQDAAQDLGSHLGKIVRVNRDGSIPQDNPFRARLDARPEIWSYGHRNDEGAAIGLDGRLWTVMQGSGGDALQQPRAGFNYGWPVVIHGSEDRGDPASRAASVPGLEGPRHIWETPVSPSGLTVYSGRLWPDWRGDLLTGALRANAIIRLSTKGATVQEAERLFEGRYNRISAVREGPDGAIWFISEGEGALYRVTPASGG
jgi:aldose sugar dehydrogenase